MFYTYYYKVYSITKKNKEKKSKPQIIIEKVSYFIYVPDIW